MFLAKISRHIATTGITMQYAECIAFDTERFATQKSRAQKSGTQSSTTKGWLR